MEISLPCSGGGFSQLLEIQKQFRAGEASKSRPGIQVNRRKLAIWDNLETKLDEVMEVKMVSLLERYRHYS